MIMAYAGIGSRNITDIERKKEQLWKDIFADFILYAVGFIPVVNTILVIVKVSVTLKNKYKR